MYTTMIIFKITYSRDIVLCKLNLFPFYVIFATLVSTLLANLFAMIETNEILFNKSEFGFIWILPTTNTFFLIKFYLFIIFAIFQVFEWHIYRKFIEYQKDLSLGELYPKRDKYQQIELDAFKKFKFFAASISIPYFALIAYNWYFFYLIKTGYFGKPQDWVNHYDILYKVSKMTIYSSLFPTAWFLI